MFAARCWILLVLGSMAESYSVNKNHRLIPIQNPTSSETPSLDRRAWLTSTLSLATLGLGGVIAAPTPANAAAAALQDSLDVESFLRTGVDAGGNMGVSSQAGKSRPITGVVFRDGSDVLQDRQTGAVSTEILVGNIEKDPKAVLVSFDCPFWKLETGPVFDVECRDRSTGDGVFLAVTQRAGGKSLSDLPPNFFLDRLFDPTGRFSFYGPPTNIQVRDDRMVKDDSGLVKRYLTVDFSNLSQSTNAELPRKALVAAMLPDGTDNVVLLVASAKASRWNKQAEPRVRQTIDSFRAIPAPKTNLKLRPKRRGDELIM